MSRFRVPEYWTMAKLESVATIVGGSTPSRKDQSFFNGDIPWATPSDLTGLDDLWIERTAESITEKALISSSVVKLPPGTVLMTSRATIGVTAIARHEMCTNQGFANFICDDKFILNEYLAYWLPFYRRRLIQLAGGTTFKEISRSTLANVDIPLPPLSEQRHIVSILHEIDELRVVKRKANNKIREILSALFYEMFGDPIQNEKNWETLRINELCDLVRGSSPRPQGDPRYFGGPVPRLMVADITRDGTYVTPKIDTLTEEGAKASRAMPAGSVVMAVSGAPGLPAILNVDACIHDGFVGFRNLNEHLDAAFFLGFLLAMRNKNTVQAIGATFQNLKTGQIKNWFVPIPPPELQRNYVSYVRVDV